jgi:hypothetical protein
MNERGRGRCDAACCDAWMAVQRPFVARLQCGAGHGRRSALQPHRTAGQRTAQRSVSRATGWGKARDRVGSLRRQRGARERAQWDEPRATAPAAARADRARRPDTGAHASRLRRRPLSVGSSVRGLAVRSPLAPPAAGRGGGAPVAVRDARGPGRERTGAHGSPEDAGHRSGSRAAVPCRAARRAREPETGTRRRRPAGRTHASSGSHGARLRANFD